MNSIEDPQLRKALAVIQGHPFVSQVRLFGSRVKGTAKPESDYDLLVIVDKETPPEPFEEPRKTSAENLVTALENRNISCTPIALGPPQPIQFGPDLIINPGQAGALHLFFHSDEYFNLAHQRGDDNRWPFNMRNISIPIYERGKE